MMKFRMVEFGTDLITNGSDVEIDMTGVRTVSWTFQARMTGKMKEETHQT